MEFSECIGTLSVEFEAIRIGTNQRAESEWLYNCLLRSKVNYGLFDFEHCGTRAVTLQEFELSSQNFCVSYLRSSSIVCYPGMFAATSIPWTMNAHKTPCSGISRMTIYLVFDTVKFLIFLLLSPWYHDRFF